MKIRHYRRDNCRLCHQKLLDLVLELVPTPPADAYIPAQRIKEAQECYPLDLYLCRDCGHVQLLEVVQPEELFRDYLYLTSSSSGMVEHFRQYAEAILKKWKPPKDSLVVDIGSNDGTLLKFFKDGGMRVLGIDAASAIAQKATESGIKTLSEFFTSQLGRKIRQEVGPAAIVTCNNAFAHADDLADMAEGIREVLAPDGIFVFEVSYLADMIQNMVFDFIYHEHLCYHSVKPLQTFLRAHGMELIDVQTIPTKGGSLRCTAQLTGGKQTPDGSVSNRIAFEEKIGLHQPPIFKEYNAKIDKIRKELTVRIQELKKNGKSFAGYGASATSTTLIYHFHLDPVLSFIADDNEQRQGLFSPGFHIPVLSPQALYEKKPDYVILLAWRYLSPILKKHQPYLNQGGHFIVPLPEIKEY